MRSLFALFLPLLLYVFDAEACLATSPVEMPMLPKCLTCAKNLITTSTSGPTVLPTLEDEIDLTSLPCAFRKMICKGNMPRISVNNGVLVYDDPGVPGMVDFTAICSQDGTAWEWNDIPKMTHVKVTKVECIARQ